jgi:protein phosphatase
MATSRRHRITLYAQTDVGMVRAGNEDTFLVLNLDTTDTWTPAVIDGEPPEEIASFEQGDCGTILAVSDGMGGALAGEVASRMAVDGVRSHMLFFQSNPTFSAYPFHERLRLSVEQANSIINDESMGNADYAGMGATFTAAGVHDGHLTLAQIGDSRCYLIRGNRIALVTHDQSLVWQLVEAGHITEEEAETHQYKNVILQALGAQPRVNVVVDRIPIHNGDAILLCSDGLSGRVRAEEMLSIVTESSSLKHACERLIQLANERGGEDNITVVLARFEDGELPPPGDLSSERIERDPNLPYDIDADIYNEAEDTLNPDRDPEGDANGASPSTTADVASHAAGQAVARRTESETSLLDASAVSSASGGELTDDFAKKLSKAHDQAQAPLPTMVGLPALTADEIAADARLRDATASEPAPVAASIAPAADAPPERKSKLPGLIIASIVCVAIVAAVWYVYQQQSAAAAEHAATQRAAASVGDRVREARSKLGAIAPTIDELAPSPQQSEARALKQSILGDLDRATPLVEPEAAKPTTVVEAKAICDHVDAEIDKLQTLVASAPRPEPLTPAESDLQP